MPDTIAPIQHVLLAAIADALPGHDVSARVGVPRRWLADPAFARPGAVLQLREVTPGGAAGRWSLHLLAADPRGAGAALAGSPAPAPPSGLLHAVASAHAALANLGADVQPASIDAPAPGVVAAEIPFSLSGATTLLAPCIAPHASLFTELTDALAEGVTRPEFLVGVAPTLRLVATIAGPPLRQLDLGPLRRFAPDACELLRPLPEALPAGTLLHSIHPPRALPVPASVTIGEDIARWRRTDPTLDGTVAATRIGPRTRTLRLAWAASAPADIEAIGELAIIHAELLLLDGSGAVHAATPTAWHAALPAGEGHATFAIRPALDLSLFHEE